MAVLWALQPSRMTAELVWECQHVECVLSAQNKVMLLWSVGFRVMRMQVPLLALVLNLQFIWSCVGSRLRSGWRRGNVNVGLLHLAQGSWSSSLKCLYINCLGTYWHWTGNRAAGWPLYIEADPACCGLLGKLTCAGNVGRRSNAGRTYDLQLCMFRVDGHEEGPSQEGYGFTIMVRALFRALTVSGGARWA
jgi:hypothetical protein